MDRGLRRSRNLRASGSHEQQQEHGKRSLPRLQVGTLLAYILITGMGDRRRIAWYGCLGRSFNGTVAVVTKPLGGFGPAGEGRGWQQAVASGELLALPAQIEYRISVTLLATALDQSFSFVQRCAEPMPLAVFPQAPSSPNAPVSSR